MSAALAMAHGVDLKQAEGNSRSSPTSAPSVFPTARRLKLCDKNSIEITKVERSNPFLLHSKVGGLI
jgi:hypothetical protein